MWGMNTNSKYTYVPVGSNTNTPCHKHAVLTSVVCFSVPFLVFQPYWGHTIQLRWTNRTAWRCNDSRDSVMYCCVTRTSITLVSKFPRKGAPLWFFGVPWNEATCSSVCRALALKGDGRRYEVSFESADLTWLIMGHDLSGILILVFVMSLSCDYHVRFMWLLWYSYRLSVYTWCTSCSTFLSTC